MKRSLLLFGLSMMLACGITAIIKANTSLPKRCCNDDISDICGFTEHGEFILGPRNCY